MNSEQLRKCVIRYREDNKMADFDVALEIGVSQDTLRRFRLGQDVMPRTLQKIEKFFTQETELSLEKQYEKALKEIKIIANKFDYWSNNLSDASNVLWEIKDKINEVLK